MSITRRVTFRLYPTIAQVKTLSYWRRLHKDLYNAAVANRQTQYKRFKKSVDYYEQQNCLPAFKEVWREYKQLGSHALQATLKRVDMAYQRFFKGLGGYPKFKSIRHYSGWTYPCIAGWKTLTDGKNGCLELSNLGRIQMRGTARTWGKPTTCTIVNRQGIWYASFTVQCLPIRETGTGAVGLDFGCLTAVAMSDGKMVENPRFLVAAKAKIGKASKAKRRKVKPDLKKKIRASKRWRKAHKKVGKLQRLVANQRQNWVHQVAAEIVSSNSLVATEKLNIVGMTRKPKKGSQRKAQKTGLNRSLLDVGMGALRSAIKYKLAEAGGIFIEVPTQKVKPSQTCPNCGIQKKKELSERVHNCPCGLTGDRDVAAAQVMLNWSQCGLGVSQSGATGVATGLGTSLDKRGSDSSTNRHCGGFKQLAEMKRQKPRPSS